MARRYGGKYSPDGAPPGTPEAARAGAAGGRGPAPFRNRRVSRVSVRARLMYLLPLPLLFAGLGAIGRGSAREMLGELGAFAGLMAGAVSGRGAVGSAPGCAGGCCDIEAPWGREMWTMPSRLGRLPVGVLWSSRHLTTYAHTGNAQPVHGVDRDEGS